MLRQLIYDNILYEGYCISDGGKLYSIKSGTLKELKPFIGKNGYKICTISCGDRNTRKHIVIHRAVAFNFIPNIGNFFTEVDHRDTDRLNNDVHNLCWTNKIGNHRNPITRQRYSQSKIGDKNPMKPSNRKPHYRQRKSFNTRGKAVRCLETLEVFSDCKVAGEAYKIDPTNIGRCCNGKRHTVNKLHWEWV